MSWVTFSARLRADLGPPRGKVGYRGINLYVDVPSRVTTRFGRRGSVPVKAVVGGRTFPATLVPAGGGRHILYVNKRMQAAAGTRRGDRVSFRLAPDPFSRMPMMHPALGAALRTRPRALAAWDRLAPSRRKEILRYLHAIKTSQAVAWNVRKLLAYLAGRPARHHALGCRSAGAS